MLILRLLPAALLACAAYGLPELGAPFGEDAVLQAGRPLPVWGTASPGEHVTVTFAGQALGASAAADGRWVVIFAPLERTDAGADLVVTGSGRASTASHGVVVGEVWLFAGGRMLGEGGRIAGSTSEPRLRQYRVSEARGRLSPPATGSAWKMDSGQGREDFSRVGLAFAQGLHASIGAPIGIILCTGEDYPVDAWMSPAALSPGVGEPWRRADGASVPGAPATQFEAMLEPLLPIGVRGVIWDGGEGDIGHAAEYARQFPMLVRAWRSHLGDPDMPFFWVQLGNAPGRGAGCALLRQAQSGALSLADTGQAVSIDLGDEAHTSADDAREIGRRLSLLARARAYAMILDDTGPVYSGAAVEGRAMRVRFTANGEGLTAAGKPLQAFEIAGADRKFHPATAAIDGDTVIVRSPAVPNPVAVRYAWQDSSPANLYSGAGLPAAPFRSGDW